MSASTVTREAVREIAADLGWQLTDAEVDVYLDRLVTQVEGLGELFAVDSSEQVPQQLAAGAGDRAWWAPTPESDPLGLFIHRCEVRTGGTGPLSGRTLALKDNIALAGVPMTLGSRALAGHVPEYDATVAARLLAAGATIVGKTNLYEFSLGDVPSGYGRTLNPADQTRETGGSSSGSAAAVASGAVDAALGGDQGGSIRIPAAWCGVVGLKPSFGLVPHTGIAGADPTIDFVGPMARTVAEVATVLDVIAGRDGLDARQPEGIDPPGYAAAVAEPPTRLRLGVLAEGLPATTGPGVCWAVEETIEALARQGHEVRQVSVPRHADAATAWLAIWLAGTHLMAQTGFGAAFHTGWYDASLVQQLTRLLPHAAELPLNLKQNVVAGEYLRRRYDGGLYPRAQNLRPELAACYDEALAGLDALVMPTTPDVAPRFTEPADEAEAVDLKVFGGGGLRLTDIVANTAAFDFTGHPAVTVPCGDVDGLPVGFQVVGRRHDDRTVLRVARAVELTRESR
ncbi:amidase family protein [Nocardioides sp. LHG3406-4]|uniref:amidase family protein n=1 Tax=Nocardioides sp. LHG3406-4 TaxID=2804575 RepID=UPI003CF1B3DF